MLNVFWTIRFELLLGGATVAIGLMGLWHEYAAQQKISHMAQECKQKEQGA